MCNCGKKRISQSDPNVNTKKEIPVQAIGQVRFEYIGKTALTIIGNFTRKQYRFNYPGDKQNIDYRDMKAMMKIAMLKKVGE